MSCFFPSFPQVRSDKTLSTKMRYVLSHATLLPHPVCAPPKLENGSVSVALPFLVNTCSAGVIRRSLFPPQRAAGYFASVDRSFPRVALSNPFRLRCHLSVSCLDRVRRVTNMLQSRCLPLRDGYE